MIKDQWVGTTVGTTTSDNTTGHIHHISIGDPLPLEMGRIEIGTPPPKPFGDGFTWTKNNNQWIHVGSAYEPEERIETKMRGLYEVYIVDPDEDEIVWETPKPFVAKDEDSAERKAIRMAGDKLDDSKDLDDYDFIVIELGSVRPKKEVKKVRVVEG